MYADNAATVPEAPEVIQDFRSEMDNGFLADVKNILERQLIPIAWTFDPSRQYHFGSLRDMSTTCTATATLQTWLSPA